MKYIKKITPIVLLLISVNANSYVIKKSIDCLRNDKSEAHPQVGEEINFQWYSVDKSNVKIIYKDKECTVYKRYFLDGIGLSKDEFEEINADYIVSNAQPIPKASLPDKSFIVSVNSSILAEDSDYLEQNIHSGTELEIVASGDGMYMVKNAAQDSDGRPIDDAIMAVDKAQLISSIPSSEREKLISISPKDYSLILNTPEKLKVEGSTFGLTKSLDCALSNKRTTKLYSGRDIVFHGNGTWGFMVSKTGSSTKCQVNKGYLLNSLSDQDRLALVDYMGGNKEVDRLLSSDIKQSIFEIASFAAPEVVNSCVGQAEEELDFEYESCKSGTTYLTKDLLAVLNKTDRDPAWQENDMAHCILASMKRNTGTSHRYCPSNAGYNSLPKTAKKPCIGPKTHELVTTQFLNTTKCLGIDPKKYFKILNHESQFVPTSRSPSGVAGISMMSSDTIVDVNRVFYGKQFSINKRSSPPPNLGDLSENPNVQKYLKDPEACGKIKDTLKKPYGNYYYNNNSDNPKKHRWAVSSCSRLRMPDNPALAMFYGAVFYINNLEKTKKNLESVMPKVVASNSDLDVKCRSAVKEEDCAKSLSKKYTEKMYEDISIWGYNAGIRGIELAFKAFSRHNGYNKPGVKVSYDTLKSRFKDWIATKSNNTQDRREEISTYLGKTENEAKHVERGLNGGVSKGYVQCTDS